MYFAALWGVGREGLCWNWDFFFFWEAKPIKFPSNQEFSLSPCTIQRTQNSWLASFYSGRRNGEAEPWTLINYHWLINYRLIVWLIDLIAFQSDWSAPVATGKQSHEPSAAAATLNQQFLHFPAPIQFKKFNFNALNGPCHTNKFLTFQHCWIWRKKSPNFVLFPSPLHRFFSFIHSSESS